MKEENQQKKFTPIIKTRAQAKNISKVTTRQIKSPSITPTNSNKITLETKKTLHLQNENKKLSQEVKCLKTSLEERNQDLGYKKKEVLLQESNDRLVKLEQKITSVLDLKGWLSNEPIQMYLDFLNDHALSSFHKAFIMNPSLCQLIKIAEDFVQVIEPLNIYEKEVLIIPINNNEGSEKSDGGSHWSLLIYYKPHKMFYHYDSLGRINLGAAMIVAKKLTEFFGYNTPYTMTSLKGSTQNNGYDCGI